MNKLYDVLEICLQELENGVSLENVLARYPDLASELRPILKASVMARTMSVPAPSPDAIRRGRAKLLQHASEMREAKAAPRKRMIPFFQRLAISFTLTALFLTSGTGLVSASSSALPGENLYSVKLTWENVRLFFTFNEEYRETLEYTFENERLHEINELLAEGKDETIQFVGVYMEVNGITYVSGVRIVILDTSTLPTAPLVNGVAVTVTGHTNAEEFVDVESIELLPEGTVVPPGPSVEINAEHNNVNENDNNNVNVNDNSNINSNDNNTNVDDNSNDSGDDNNSVNDGGSESNTGNSSGSDDANDSSVDGSNNNEDSNDDSSVSDGEGDNSNDSHDDSSGSGGDDSHNDSSENGS